MANAIAMIFITSFLFMVVALVNLEGLLRLFGASDESMPYAVEYMRIILYASVLQGPAVGMNHFMRADGSPKTAMLSMFIGAGFNIVFDYILIYLFDMGMTGAALATIGGQGLSALWGLSYFISKRSNIRLQFSKMKLKRSLIGRIIAAGLPSFTNQISGSILSLVLNKNLGFMEEMSPSEVLSHNSLQQLL